jgi:hypothetical protein
MALELEHMLCTIRVFKDMKQHDARTKINMSIVQYLLQVHNIKHSTLSAVRVSVPFRYTF